jgi:hypothetical protein
VISDRASDRGRAGDVVRWPYGAVETAPIDERDIAAVAVRALSEASLAGGDYVLTGPAALSHARQVAVIGEVLGRRLAFHELSPDDFRRETAASWPPPVVELALLAAAESVSVVCLLRRWRRSDPWWTTALVSPIILLRPRRARSWPEATDGRESVGWRRR